MPRGCRAHAGAPPRSDRQELSQICSIILSYIGNYLSRPARAGFCGRLVSPRLINLSRLYATLLSVLSCAATGPVSRSRAMGREWLRRRAGVLAVRDFRRFYTGYATSLLGSSMSTVAIAWAVLDSGASATGLGYVFAAAVVPQVLLMAIAGAIADRLGRRRVMLTADALRCAAQASLAAAVFAGRPAIWVFVLLAGLVGTGEAFFTPAMDALT